mmetsp:Transcript_11600/g.13645  ORF Transcript_11600/g.13645 Transcript_11600/m.13645 type:complete len:129 (-) Transcript_11600:52-438(-)
MLSRLLSLVLEEDGGACVDRDFGDAFVALVLVAVVDLLVQEDDDGNDGDCRLSSGGGGSRFVALESQLDTRILEAGGGIAFFCWWWLLFCDDDDERDDALLLVRRVLIRGIVDGIGGGGLVGPKKASS